jgi:hypothetical protein
MNAINPNLSTCPSELFTRFIRFVQDQHFSENGTTTVEDLRVATRLDRLTEYSTWTFDQLDEIEAECSLYRRDTALADLS